MSVDGRFKVLRALVGNAVLWGFGWFAASLTILTSIYLLKTDPSGTWLDLLGLAVKIGFWGGIAGAVFSSVISLAYRGRRLSEISALRFAIAGGIVTGLMIPLALQALNIIFGDGPIAWNLVSDDMVLGGVFGFAAAGASLKLAQRATRGLPDGDRDELDASGIEADPGLQAPRTSGLTRPGA